MSGGDRGDIILNFPQQILQAGQCISFSFLTFSYNSYKEFIDICQKYCAVVECSNYFPEINENVKIKVCGGETAVVNEQTIKFENDICVFVPLNIGEQKIKILYNNGKETHIRLFVKNKDVVKIRTDFVINNQVSTSKNTLNAFLAYNNKDNYMKYKKGLRSPFNAAGYCAAPLLALLGGINAGNISYDKIKDIVDNAIKFYDKEVLNGGEVFDNIGKKHVLFFKRNYSYPLFATIKLEEYILKGNLEALMQSAAIMVNYYRSGRNYKITPTTKIIEELVKAGKEVVADNLAQYLIMLADNIINKGNKYAFAHGQSYSRQLVCGALMTLCDAYLYTKNENYLINANEHLCRLNAFDGIQPDYRLHDVPIVFEKNISTGINGDMMPHFSAVESAYAYYKYFIAFNNTKYLTKAKNITNACLTLFDINGYGYRSFMQAYTINGINARGYEQISCGEDIVLYYYSLIFEMQ